MGRRLLIVSNRLPVSVTKRKGSLQFHSSVGGLATALSSMSEKHPNLWIGWDGITQKVSPVEKEEIKKKLAPLRCVPVYLSKYDIENYYYGFCNKTIWPLFHYFPIYTIFKKSYWEAYRRVNISFCEQLIKIYKKGDIVWVHDYHLFLLPGLIRQEFPEAEIGFFLHIPFPSYEVFRLIPWRRAILRGILGADLIGFHTYSYAEYFLDSVMRILGHEHTFGQIVTETRVCKVDVFPLGIDFEKFHRSLERKEVAREISKLQKRVGERKVILSIDRLDYTKGIIQRLEAFDLFLERFPEYCGKVTMILVAIPSRTSVEHYAMLKNKLDEVIGKINGKHGTIGWVPIWYLYRSVPFHTLSGLYNIADVCLVTPLRDGMNLIAKEFVATKQDGKGVLILSEMAGAVNELGEAIVVNPYNTHEVAFALKESMSMSESEQIEKNRRMQKRLARYNVIKWANDFMEKLRMIKTYQKELAVRKLSEKLKQKIINKYKNSSRKLFLLDYDGTLIGFYDRPEKATPDREIINILKSLTYKDSNTVVIISGRNREILEKWFGNMRIGLVAEHGAWMRQEDGKWQMVEAFSQDWKEEIRPILEQYVDRTPASFIEEKDYCLVWHYRKVDPELGTIRANELKNDIIKLTANLNLTVLEGNKVIEIKNAGINKGRASLFWLNREKWDFVFAAGDDLTDEDIFAVIPEDGFSFKVGLHPSHAKINVDSWRDIRSILGEIGGEGAVAEGEQNLPRLQ